MIKKIGITISFLMLLFLPQMASADGGVFPPADKYVTETDQKAVIAYEGTTETLILSVNFKGNPDDFGWVIPIPSKPEVNKSQDEIFTSLKELTAIQKQEESIIPNLGSSKTTQEAFLRVEIIETKKIDIFDISVVTSKSAKDLSTWLSKNNYQIPKAASTIFDDYIKNNWYFICIKVDLSTLTATAKEQLKTGHATPLKIQFESDEIIYPLKLTSILSEYESSAPTKSSETVSGLTPLPQLSFLIYVLADSKLTVPGLEVKYGNWVKKDEIKNLALDLKGNSWYEPKISKMFLTKFYGTMKTSEMTNDLIFRPAENNDPIGTTSSNVAIDILMAIVAFALVFIITTLSPIGLLFIILTLIQFFSRNRTTQIICWVLQILDLLLSLLVALIISMVSLRNLNLKYSLSETGQTLHFNWSNIASIVAVFALVIVEIILLIWQYKYHKRKELENGDNPEKLAENMFDAKKESNSEPEPKPEPEPQPKASATSRSASGGGQPLAEKSESEPEPEPKKEE